MKIEVEILRTRKIEIEESATVEVKVPASVPEDERTDWIKQQLEDGELEVDDTEFEVSDETEEVGYDEVNEI